MAPRFIDASELRELLPMAAAVDALDAAFAAGLSADMPPRTHLGVDDATLLLMPAAGAGGAGVKLVTVTPSNPGRGLPYIQAVYVLFAPETLEPVAVIEGGALTAIRTAAVSGVATRHLAARDAGRLVIFGAGTQATSHLDAMRAVRPISEVVVVSRTRAPAERLVERAHAAGVEARVGEVEDVATADIVCTCTTSDSPLFDGALLAAGAHVNAVGAFQPSARELDDTTLTRAKLVVEAREAALAEAGDILIPLEHGVIGEDHIVAELAEVAGGKSVRTDASEITVFKSVGLASEDLVVARAAMDRLPAAS